MTDQDNIEEVAVRIARILHEAEFNDDPGHHPFTIGHVHISHHEYVNELLEQRRERREMWNNAKKSAIGWAVVTFCAGILAFGIWIADLVIKELGSK